MRTPRVLLLGACNAACNQQCNANSTIRMTYRLRYLLHNLSSDIKILQEQTNKQWVYLDKTTMHLHLLPFQI